jgi:hypothetical protein
VTRSIQHVDSTPLDPDPFTVATLILSAIGTASGVFSTVYTRSVRREQSKERRNRRTAAVHRWEANLHDLRDILEELRGFVARSRLDQAHGEHKGPLQPLSPGPLLSARDLGRYRRTLNKLISQTKRLNDDTFKLIELIDDQRTVSYMTDTASRMRETLKKLRSMESVEQSIADALQGIDVLLQTAAFLRQEII